MVTLHDVDPYPDFTRPAVSSLQMLEQLCQDRANGHLELMGDSVKWYIDIDAGRISHVRHSINPIRGLAEHLRCSSAELYDEIQTLLLATRGNDSPDTHQILMVLVEQQRLTVEKAADLSEAVTRRAFEFLLCSAISTHRFLQGSPRLVPTRSFDLKLLASKAQQRLAKWRSMGGLLESPYQRLYYVGPTMARQQPLPEIHHKLQARLRGLTIRSLSLALSQDELALCQWLKPYVREGIIRVKDPQSPYDQLPRLTTLVSSPLHPEPVRPSPPSLTIACVDDSVSITQEICRHLEGIAETVAINDPLKALMDIVRLQPDLILMDVGMPFLDGYDLCRLLRRNESFKKTPIIMVTGHTGLIDRARATMVGATDYLTKPFEPSELRRVVLQHLLQKSS